MMLITGACRASFGIVGGCVVDASDLHIDIPGDVMTVAEVQSRDRCHDV